MEEKVTLERLDISTASNIDLFVWACALVVAAVVLLGIVHLFSKQSPPTSRRKP